MAGRHTSCAQNTNRVGGSAIDQRSRCHPGYRQSLNARREIGKVFGWIKQAAGLRQCKHRGRSTVGGVFLLHVIAYFPPNANFTNS